MEKKQIKKIRQYFFLFIGILLFLYVLHRFNYQAIDLGDLQFTFVAISFLIILTFTSFLIRAKRWQILLLTNNISISFWDAYLYVVPSSSIAAFSPGQVGDLLRLELLKDHKEIKRSQSLVTLVIEKIMDFTTIFLASLVMLISIPSLRSYFNLLTLFLFTLFITCLLIAFSYILYKKILPITELFNTFFVVIQKKRILLFAYLWSILLFVNISLVLFLFAQITSINTSIFILVGINSLSTILQLISFIPGGVGVLELTTSYMLETLSGVTAEHALLYVLLFRFYLIIKGIIGYCHMFFLSK